ncbi:MAG: cytochrome b [Pseudomonadota bacterium]
MNWRNTPETYGLVSILVHWLVAAAVIGLFALGLWMVALDYHDAWYYRAPALHKDLGMLVLAVLVFRWLWQRISPRPLPLASHTAVARAAHALLNLVLLAVIVSGYLVAGADGSPVNLFGLAELPAIVLPLEQQEEIAGEVHWYLSLGLVALAAIHALGALFHHFIHHDRTLLRMLSISRPPHPEIDTPRKGVTTK